MTLKTRAPKNSAGVDGERRAKRAQTRERGPLLLPAEFLYCYHKIKILIQNNNIRCSAFQKYTYRVSLNLKKSPQLTLNEKAQKSFCTLQDLSKDIKHAMVILDLFKDDFESSSSSSTRSMCQGHHHIRAN